MSYRKTLIKLVTFLGGIYYFLEFILPETIKIGDQSWQFNRYHEQIVLGFIVFGSMAVGLGIINLIRFHGGRLLFARPGWINSLALLLGLGFMMWITIADWMVSNRVASQAQQFFTLRDFAVKIAAEPQPNSEREALLTTSSVSLVARVTDLPELAHDPIGRFQGSPVERDNLLSAHKALLSALEDLNQLLRTRISNQTNAPDPILTAALGQVGVLLREYLTIFTTGSTTVRIYRLFFDGVFTALGTAMFALLGFYIATAAYRAFRVRSAESALMMLAALIVMLGQIPFGIWIWDEFPAIRLWLLETPSTAARRAVEIGAAIAGLIMAFRMWLSIESESFTKR